MAEPKRLVSLVELADTLGLPVRWLHGEAVAGRIPSLRVGRRMFVFNAQAVESALAERAAAGESVTTGPVEALADK